jgi:dTDP-4-amino-4,6-dideoxygalactose transaminase
MSIKKHVSRRQFVTTVAAGTLAGVATGKVSAHDVVSKKAGVPAILGGQPVRTKGWSKWPIWDRSAEDKILEVVRSGNWFRGRDTKVDEFEKRYAELIGAKRCLATASGTTALLTAMYALGIEAGDEILVAPYTFIATYNVVFLNKALPVFVDTNQETFTMDPEKIEERINERTRAILPVHILGFPADMDAINAIAKKHNLLVIEDACQAWLAEYHHKKCGTLGDLGCFSFQNSKNLPAGEGGAVTGDDHEIMDRCHSFHNCGRPYQSVQTKSSYPIRGTNYRMQQFQAVILMSQMERIQKDADTRLENALYLTSKIQDIPGILTYKMAPGATRSAYHLYPIRYKKEHFNGLSRERFLEAMTAEGVRCIGGYGPQYKDGLIEDALNSESYKRLFSPQRLAQYREENHYPNNDQLCREAVWFGQEMLLGTKSDMDDIADAILKVHENSKKLLV